MVTSQNSIEPVVVVTTADNNFAMQLATMARSLIANTRRHVRLYVLDGGINQENKDRIRSSLPPDQLDLVCLRPDASAVQGLKVGGHLNESTYYRLQLGELLPADVHKIIYLDADVIVLGDVDQLWQKEIGEYCVSAVKDCLTPHMDVATIERYRQYSNYYRFRFPLRLFEKLKIPPTASYFNAGVMTIDVDTWRRQRVGELVLEYLRENHEHVRFVDQDGLNAVLWDQWNELDPCWNQTTSLFRFPNWKSSPYESEAYHEARYHPKIVHFAGGGKPWNAGEMHPHRREFFAFLDQTAWAGWGKELRAEWPMRWPRVWNALRIAKQTTKQVANGLRKAT